MSSASLAGSVCVPGAGARRLRKTRPGLSYTQRRATGTRSRGAWLSGTPRPPDGPSGGSHGCVEDRAFSRSVGRLLPRRGRLGNPRRRRRRPLPSLLFIWGGKGSGSAPSASVDTARPPDPETLPSAPSHALRFPGSQAGVKCTKPCSGRLAARSVSEPGPVPRNPPVSVPGTISCGPTMCCSRWRRVSGGRSSCGSGRSPLPGVAPAQRQRLGAPGCGVPVGPGRGRAHTRGCVAGFIFPGHGSRRAVGDVTAAGRQCPICLHRGLLMVRCFQCNEKMDTV